MKLHFAATLLFAAAAAGAEDTAEAHVIRSGLAYSAAAGQLTAAGIRETSTLSMQSGDADIALTFYSIDPQQVLIVAHSKSSNLVSRLTLCIVPPDASSLTDKTSRAVLDITFNPDKSYTIHYPPHSPN